MCKFQQPEAQQHNMTNSETEIEKHTTWSQLEVFLLKLSEYHRKCNTEADKNL